MVSRLDELIFRISTVEFLLGLGGAMLVENGASRRLEESDCAERYE